VRVLVALLALLAVVRADPVSHALADPVAPVAKKLIAISFDDAPRSPGAFMTPDERTAKLIATMRDLNVPQAAFYLNTARISNGDGDVRRIESYVSAGHVIANHSATHKHLSRTSAATYLADVDAAEAWLKGRAGYRPWFRYPFLDEGGEDKAKRDAVRAGLKARGIRSAYCTVDGSDWNIERLTVEARKAGKAIDMAALRDLYVETHVESANFADALAVRALGRSPVHVLLLHETDIAALFLGDLVAALRADGWEIVGNDTAYADPVYDSMLDIPFANGTLVEMLAWDRKLTGPRWYERNDVKIGNALFAERVLHGK